MTVQHEGYWTQAAEGDADAHAAAVATIRAQLLSDPLATKKLINDIEDALANPLHTQAIEDALDLQQQLTQDSPSQQEAQQLLDREAERAQTAASVSPVQLDDDTSIGGLSDLQGQQLTVLGRQVSISINGAPEYNQDTEQGFTRQGPDALDRPGSRLSSNTSQTSQLAMAQISTAFDFEMTAGAADTPTLRGGGGGASRPGEMTLPVRRRTTMLNMGSESRRTTAPGFLGSSSGGGVFGEAGDIGSLSGADLLPAAAATMPLPRRMSFLGPPGEPPAALDRGDAVTRSGGWRSSDRALFHQSSSKGALGIGGSPEGSMYGDFGPLADLADAVAAANNNSSGQSSGGGGLRSSMGGTGGNAAKTSPLAYMLVPEFINTPTLNRLRAELAAIAKQTMPDQNGFKVASEKLLARISKFNNLEDASAQAFRTMLEALLDNIFVRVSPSRGRGGAKPPRTGGTTPSAVRPATPTSVFGTYAAAAAVTAATAATADAAPSRTPSKRASTGGLPLAAAAADPPSRSQRAGSALSSSSDSSHSSSSFSSGSSGHGGKGAPVSTEVAAGGGGARGSVGGGRRRGSTVGARSSTGGHRSRHRSTAGGGEGGSGGGAGAAGDGGRQLKPSDSMVRSAFAKLALGQAMLRGALGGAPATVFDEGGKAGGLAMEEQGSTVGTPAVGLSPVVSSRASSLAADAEQQQEQLVMAQALQLFQQQAAAAKQQPLPWEDAPSPVPAPQQQAPTLQPAAPAAVPSAVTLVAPEAGAPAAPAVAAGGAPLATAASVEPALHPLLTNMQSAVAQATAAAAAAVAAAATAQPPPAATAAAARPVTPTRALPAAAPAAVGGGQTAVQQVAAGGLAAPGGDLKQRLMDIVGQASSSPAVSNGGAGVGTQQAAAAAPAAAQLQGMAADVWRSPSPSLPGDAFGPAAAWAGDAGGLGQGPILTQKSFAFGVQSEAAAMQQTARLFGSPTAPSYAAQPQQQQMMVTLAQQQQQQGQPGKPLQWLDDIQLRSSFAQEPAGVECGWWHGHPVSAPVSPTWGPTHQGYAAMPPAPPPAAAAAGPCYGGPAPAAEAGAAAPHQPLPPAAGGGAGGSPGASDTWLPVVRPMSRCHSSPAVFAYPGLGLGGGTLGRTSTMSHHPAAAAAPAAAAGGGGYHGVPGWPHNGVGPGSCSSPCSEPAAVVTPFGACRFLGSSAAVSPMPAAPPPPAAAADSVGSSGAGGPGGAPPLRMHPALHAAGPLPVSGSPQRNFAAWGVTWVPLRRATLWQALDSRPWLAAGPLRKAALAALAAHPATAPRSPTRCDQLLCAAAAAAGRGAACC